jgi:hypothetical protein
MEIRDPVRRPAPPEVLEGWVILGTLVRERRCALGWTQRELRDATGVDQSSLSRLENGRLPGLRWWRFARIVGAMGGLDPGLPHPPRPRRWQAWSDWG